MLSIRKPKPINWKTLLHDAYGISSDQRALFIENKSRDILYISNSLYAIFDIQTHPEYARFGNLVQCRHVSGTKYACGTRRQCKNCRLKNALDASWYLQNSFEKIRLNQHYTYGGKLRSKWLTATLTPVNAGHESFMLVELREDTQTIQKIIDKELSVLEKSVEI